MPTDERQAWLQTTITRLQRLLMRRGLRVEDSGQTRDLPRQAGIPELDCAPDSGR